MNGIWIFLAILVPCLTGIVLLFGSAMDKWKNRPEAHGEELKKLHYLSMFLMVLSGILTVIAVLATKETVTWFKMFADIPIAFRVDKIAILFALLFTAVWVPVCLYSFEYMKHEEDEKRFFGFYILVYGVLMGLCFSENLITMYMFYELMSLTSMPLVLHSGSKESIMAALKYLLYSMCGAYFGLFGIFFLYRYCDTMSFVAGGSLNTAAAAGHTGLLLAAVFCMLVGFGVKAGMFPFHAWLPTAHPVAPSPASAVLSGIIVKCGVLALVRTVYYVVGADFIRGTWVQTAWMTLSLITVFMGSMLAYQEKIVKKRFAYSTVSQVSYIVFGLSLLTQTGLTGALLHTVFHAFIKCTLFLVAGVFLVQGNIRQVDDLKGIGKVMPKTLWCFTFAALALVGIPPCSGFISKWYLATGALSADIGVFRYVGPAVLLVSALLTAGYLLTITVKGFLPGDDVSEAALKCKEPSWMMLVPLCLFAFLSVALGIFSGPLVSYLAPIVESVL